MEDYYLKRSLKLIKEAIAKVSLNLSGYTVLTEVGSNSYLFTPIIAALANAQKVYAWTADTNYGKGEEIKRACLDIAEELGIDSKIEIAVNIKPPEHIVKANIVTNSGFIRPLDSELLKHANHSGIAIPLMYEAWELRTSDIDIEYCKAHNIKVAGTWESHPSLKVFQGIGPLAIKMAMEAGLEIYENKILVWSDDDFGKEITDTFKKIGAAVVKTTNIDTFYQELPELDFIFIADYQEKRKYFGNEGIFDIDLIKKQNPALAIIHLYGDVNVRLLKEHQLNVSPLKNGNSLTMTYTLGHLGLYPIIKLQTAGFKVGQSILENVKCDFAQPITY